MYSDAITVPYVLNIVSTQPNLVYLAKGHPK